MTLSMECGTMQGVLIDTRHGMYEGRSAWRRPRRKRINSISMASGGMPQGARPSRSTIPRRANCSPKWRTAAQRRRRRRCRRRPTPSRHGPSARRTSAPNCSTRHSTSSRAGSRSTPASSPRRTASRWRNRGARRPSARASCAGTPRRRAAPMARSSPARRRASASSPSGSRSASSRRSRRGTSPTR